MDHHADLALSKQAFDDLLALCTPENVRTWQPSTEQRAHYIRLAERALDGLEKLETLEQRRLLTEGQLHSVIPESLLAFVRDQMKPRVSAIRTALDCLDPDGKLLRELLARIGRPSGARVRVRGTFEEGLQQIYQLLERNPDWGDDHHFLPDTAYDVLDSKLIQFEPDAWLDRAGELLPIRTHKSSLVLPIHVRLRLEELYRAYIFGLWLSVFALSRAILEYSILDNLSKFKIEPTWPPDRDGSRKEKKLSHIMRSSANISRSSRSQWVF